jgi:hypothetical protein
MCNKATEEIIKEHFRLPAQLSCPIYLLLCNGGRVTVRSQQMRAINLIWALRPELQRCNRSVAVIGAGAAGITFAAAAAKLGATVHLFESSDLMHLQVGSFHRPLHPEIYTWPEETAYRPVSHLPLLGWTTGTAHDVATEILSKFHALKEELNGNLNVHTRKRVTVTPEGSLKANGELFNLEWQAIVLAVGFGVEDSFSDLPLNSYWRVDALDQSEEDNGKQDNGKLEVVVCGSGDGALIEVLRSRVQETEQGVFLDTVLAITLRDSELLRKIRDIENGPRRGRGAEVWMGYRGLDKDKYKSIGKIDELLNSKSRDIKVTWLFRGQDPFTAGPDLLSKSANLP